VAVLSPYVFDGGMTDIKQARPRLHPWDRYLAYSHHPPHEKTSVIGFALELEFHRATLSIFNGCRDPKPRSQKKTN
jgi:hypothetical protein